MKSVAHQSSATVQFLFQFSYVNLLFYKLRVVSNFIRNMINERAKFFNLFVLSVKQWFPTSSDEGLCL